MTGTLAQTVLNVLTFVVPMVLAIVFHEVAHGRMARLLGDPTAADRGRLSLNPLRHVDPFGTVILPGALLLTGSPVFGWAKPVPVDYNRLRHPQRDMALVGAAGPLTNFVLATLTAVVLGLIARAVSGEPGLALAFVVQNLQNFILINVSLGMFNLLPLPPFDGSRIVRGFLPWSAARVMDRIEPFGIIVLFALIVVVPQVWPGLHLLERVLLPPLGWMLDQMAALTTLVAGGAAGAGAA